jgi:hypothetical protein
MDVVTRLRCCLRTPINLILNDKIDKKNSNKKNQRKPDLTNQTWDSGHAPHYI